MQGGPGKSHLVEVKLGEEAVAARTSRHGGEEAPALVEADSVRMNTDSFGYL
jgi:hypothetical protein